LVDIRLAKLVAPCGDGLIGHAHPTDEPEFFHITVAERETEIQPDNVADDLPGEPMMFVQIDSGWGCHGSSTE
jgi:hypothetical protein